ncbi:hypothetical protein AB0M46_06310 [Dactylosporangium sp. NPDC051485]|uniref:hypothetical protein n=1 Tax=Dactylosporangium sp. NPDC051485 TaxID=3154846 RepID=UPI00343A6BD9
MKWDEAVEIFRRRGLPEETYRNLYQEEYILHPGPARVDGPFPLNFHEDAHPWNADTPEAATGYIVDGDLTIEGNLYDEDDGAAALVVLGRLKARDVFFGCDTKLIVLGDVEVGLFAGEMTDKLVMLHGDLRTVVTALDAEFEPDLVAGTHSGRLVAPAYVDLDVEDATAGRPLSDLLVDEVISGDGVDFDALRERVPAGEPVIRPGLAAGGGRQSGSSES